MNDERLSNLERELQTIKERNQRVEGSKACSLIPVAGYFLSAQSLPPIKKWWISRRIHQ